MTAQVSKGKPANTSSEEILDLIIIGSGFGGLGMAFHAARQGQRFLVLERADDVGGTWRDNIYPGVACDTQSHHYSFSFAPNPDWSRRFAPGPEIHAYLRDTANRFGITRNIRFGCNVTRLRFDTADTLWHVESSRGTFRARTVVSAMGQLTEPAFPALPGLADFAGPVLHTARWDAGFSASGKRIGVIGTGASAIQLVPELAAEADHLTLFQRSAPWMCPKDDRDFTESEKRRFRRFPLWQRLYRYSIYWSWERSWPEFLDGSRRQKRRSREMLEWLDGQVASPELRRQMTPDYPLGCKRVLLSDTFLPALERPNVDVCTAPIRRVTPGGVELADGSSIDLDMLALATGFTAQEFLPGLAVIGAEGKELHEVWEEAGGAEGYLGIMVPGFPNFFMMYGPNTNLGHNSIVFMLECQAHFISKAIRRLHRSNKKTIAIDSHEMAGYQQTLQDELAQTAWAGNCTSWYKTGSDKITSNWSTTTLGYWLKSRFWPKRLSVD